MCNHKASNKAKYSYILKVSHITVYGEHPKTAKIAPKMYTEKYKLIPLLFYILVEF